MTLGRKEGWNMKRAAKTGREVEEAFDVPRFTKEGAGGVRGLEKVKK